MMKRRLGGVARAMAMEQLLVLSARRKTAAVWVNVGGRSELLDKSRDKISRCQQHRTQPCIKRKRLL